MNACWYRPNESPKKAFMEAISLLHDMKPQCVENWKMSGYYARWCRMDSHYIHENPIEKVVGKILRPIHKHRKLIDLYWTKPNSKWMFRPILAQENMKWSDCIEFWSDHGKRKSSEDWFKNHNNGSDENFPDIEFKEPKWYLGLTYSPHPVFEQELHEKFVEVINKNTVLTEV